MRRSGLQARSTGPGEPVYTVNLSCSTAGRMQLSQMPHIIRTAMFPLCVDHIPVYHEATEV